MSELDLNKAIESAAYALDPDVFDASDDVPTAHFGREEAREDARNALTAALPHILEALADELDAEADSEYRGHGEWSPEHQAAKILRAKAVNHGHPAS